MTDEKSHLVLEQADNHSATQLGDDPRVLTAYRRDRLLVPTAALAATPGLIDGVNDQLAGAGKGRVISAPIAGLAAGTAAPFTAVSVDGDAIEAWEAMRQQGGVPAGIMLERLIGTDTLVAFGEKQGHGDAGRMPVALSLAAPPWRTMPPGARRAVVAVFDTVVDPHPWWPDTQPSGSFVIDAESAHDWKSGLPAGGGEVDRYTGHGTFIAGLIRQQAPDAQVLSIRVMSDDGVVQSSTFVEALDWLVRKIDASAPEPFVDVVCLAFGYRPLSPQDDPHTEDLRTRIGALAARNVRVVASAGNLGQDVKTYPAAFSAEFAQVTAVGALNPNGDKAHYSNHGDDWVTTWEVGTGVISAMPAVDGAGEPAADATVSYPETAGVAVDPDDFGMGSRPDGSGVRHGGFARWSGTSFAAAVHAGKRAQEIMAGAPLPPS